MDDTSPISLSPLHETHLRAGARMVPFAGWNMPVQYKGITGEHLAVRRGVPPRATFRWTKPAGPV